MFLDPFTGFLGVFPNGHNQVASTCWAVGGTRSRQRRDVLEMFAPRFARRKSCQPGMLYLCTVHYPITIQVLVTTRQHKANKPTKQCFDIDTIRFSPGLEL